MTIVIIGEATTAARIAIESAEATMSIVATRSTRMTAAAIMGITSTIGGNTNTGAIGAHGMNGTGMPESIPVYTNMDAITATTPI